MELTRGAALTNGRRFVRALAVLVFAFGLASSAARVFGTRFEPIFLLPAVLPVVFGWVVARLTIAARVIAFAVTFVAAGLLVAYSTGGTVNDFQHGLLDGPRQLVTTTWPSPRFPTIFVAVAALIAVATSASIDVAMRTRWRALPIVPMVVAMVAIIAVGAPDGPQWPAVLCAAVASFALLWIGLDDRVASARSGSVIAVAAGLAALTTTLGVSVAVAQRANPRHRADANQQLSLLDPLADIAAQQNTSPAVALYRVASADLSQLHRWRVAALDVYNGESWSTTGRLTPLGNRIDEPSGAGQVTVSVTALRDGTDLWVTPGRLLRSTGPVESDSKHRVVRIVGTTRPVSTTFTLEPIREFDASSPQEPATIQPSDIESTYATFARGLAPSGTLADKVAQLASTLRGYTLNSRLSGGVQQAGIDRFLRDTKIGNREQFVAGFVLLVRSLSIDARVATGYRLDTSATVAEITTDRAEAWPEVRTDSGWVGIDVFPEDSNVPANDEGAGGRPQTPPAPQSIDPTQVDQPDPDKPVDPPVAVHARSTWAVVRTWAVRGALFTALLVWPLVVFAAVVSWKKLRRRRGLKAPDPARRVTTAWTLATDALVDAGATLQTSQTNAELVEAGVRLQPAAGAPLGRLQRHADAVTFATAACDPQRASDAVDQLRLVEVSIRNSSSRWWRCRWWLSTRSLRRRTQSPLR